MFHFSRYAFLLPNMCTHGRKECTLCTSDMGNLILTKSSHADSAMPSDCTVHPLGGRDTRSPWGLCCSLLLMQSVAILRDQSTKLFRCLSTPCKPGPPSRFQSHLQLFLCFGLAAANGSEGEGPLYTAFQAPEKPNTLTPSGNTTEHSHLVVPLFNCCENFSGSLQPAGETSLPLLIWIGRCNMDYNTKGLLHNLGDAIYFRNSQEAKDKYFITQRLHKTWCYRQALKDIVRPATKTKPQTTTNTA